MLGNHPWSFVRIAMTRRLGSGGRWPRLEWVVDIAVTPKCAAGRGGVIFLGIVQAIFDCLTGWR